MSAETKQVLEMLREGKITTEEAEKLLDKLSGCAGTQPGPSSGQATGSDQSATSAPGGAKKQRFLRIQVERPGRDQVNMRVPLALARTTSLLAMVHPRAAERLAEQGIDLSRLGCLNEAQLAEAVEQLNIDIDRGNGKKVRIFCE